MKTKPELIKKITQYGTLVTAIGAVADASGQIIYTDVEPDVGGFGVVYNLDMDNDSNVDFFIQHMTTYSGNPQNMLLAGAAYSSFGMESNGILAGIGSYSMQAYPFALNAGDVISEGNSDWIIFWNQFMNNDSCGWYSSNWCGVTDRYLGLNFHIGDELHYGWARLDVATNGADWVIKDYAYNSVADEPIEAGQMPLGIKESAMSKVEIISLNKTVAFYNLPGNTTEYRIINMTGQLVLQGNFADKSYVLHNNALTSGVYVIELIDEATGASLRKKVML